VINIKAYVGLVIQPNQADVVLMNLLTCSPVINPLLSVSGQHATEHTQVTWEQRSETTNPDSQTVNSRLQCRQLMTPANQSSVQNI